MGKIFDFTIAAVENEQVIKIPGHGGDGAMPKGDLYITFLLIIIPILKETKTTFIQL
jgi:hypothetical protein